MTDYFLYFLTFTVGSVLAGFKAALAFTAVGTVEIDAVPVPTELLAITLTLVEI